MNINSRLTEWHPEMTSWRRELHAHPQTAFEETFPNCWMLVKCIVSGSPNIAAFVGSDATAYGESGTHCTGIGP